MSKCCVCDNHGATMHYAPSDDMYHATCWASVYEADEYQQGYDMAMADIEAGDITAKDGLFSFENDPPENARHYGYEAACADTILKEQGYDC